MHPERASSLIQRPERASLGPGEFEDMCRTVIRESRLREAAEQMLAVEYVTVGAVGGQLSPQYMAAKTALREAIRQREGVEK